MKVIIPTNTVPNSILLQDIDPSKGIIIVYKNQVPYGFITYDDINDVYYLQTNTICVESSFYAETISALVNSMKEAISEDIYLEYFKNE